MGHGAGRDWTGRVSFPDGKPIFLIVFIFLFRKKLLCLEKLVSHISLHGKFPSCHDFSKENL
jgi:hypothetical protein